MTQFYAISLFVVCLLMFVGCSADPGIDSKTVFVPATGTPPDDTRLWGEVQFGDPAHNTWGTDAYVVNTTPSITDDVLTLNVSYSGGCKTHEFTLVTSGVFLESAPVELQAILAHNANGDSCEAWITETYHFDVSPLKEAYQKTYHTQTGTLRLRVKGMPTLVYTF